jgi:hypothetical protein
LKPGPSSRLLGEAVTLFDATNLFRQDRLRRQEAPSTVLGGFANASDGLFAEILAFALVRVKLLPNLFLSPLELRVAVIANTEQGRHAHEPKFSFADHFPTSFPQIEQTGAQNLAAG